MNDRPLMCPQTAPGVQGKVESVLARLGRLKAETGRGTADGEDESDRQMVLFEWVSFIRRGRVRVLIPFQSAGKNQERPRVPI